MDCKLLLELYPLTQVARSYAQLLSWYKYHGRSKGPSSLENSITQNVFILAFVHHTECLYLSLCRLWYVVWKHVKVKVSGNETARNSIHVTFYTYYRRIQGEGNIGASF